jgi:hypothetical protein
VLSNATRFLHGERDTSVNAILGEIISTHLTLPSILLLVTSVALLVWRRNQQIIIGLTWVACVVGGSVVFAGAYEPARYAFGALPAYFILIATLMSEARTMVTRRVVIVILSAALATKLWTIGYVYPSGAGGYEAAAEYALAQGDAPAILFDSFKDTGYFVFFVRKHDPAGQHIVLRADKVFRTAPSGDPAADAALIEAPLRKLGVRFIVVESPRQEGELQLRRFHDHLKSDRFIERRRIPIVSTALYGAELVVYEFKDAQPPDLDAELDIDLPLGERAIKLRLRDLVGELRK